MGWAAAWREGLRGVRDRRPQALAYLVVISRLDWEAEARAAALRARAAAREVDRPAAACCDVEAPIACGDGAAPSACCDGLPAGGHLGPPGACCAAGAPDACVDADARKGSCAGEAPACRCDGAARVQARAPAPACCRATSGPATEPHAGAAVAAP